VFFLEEGVLNVNTSDPRGGEGDFLVERFDPIGRVVEHGEGLS
jgi:hypothetical protein